MNAEAGGRLPAEMPTPPCRPDKIMIMRRTPVTRRYLAIRTSGHRPSSGDFPEDGGSGWLAQHRGGLGHAAVHLAHV